MKPGFDPWSWNYDPTSSRCMLCCGGRAYTLLEGNVLQAGFPPSLSCNGRASRDLVLPHQEIKSPHSLAGLITLWGPPFPLSGPKNTALMLCPCLKCECHMANPTVYTCPLLGGDKSPSTVAKRSVYRQNCPALATGRDLLAAWD